MKHSQVIAELLSGEEVDGLKNIFNGMDVQNKGSISYEELKTGLHKLGSQLAENEVQQLMEAVSTFLTSKSLLFSFWFAWKKEQVLFWIHHWLAMGFPLKKIKKQLNESPISMIVCMHTEHHFNFYLNLSLVWKNKVFFLLLRSDSKYLFRCEK